MSEEKEVIQAATLRERMEQHRADPACATCHQKMDALGFGFENFDPTGAWRDQDGEYAINPSGTLPDGQAFRTPKELKSILVKQSDAVAKALTEKLLTYALGRGLELSDRCVTDQVAAVGASSEITFRTLIVEIVRSIPFRQTRDAVMVSQPTATSQEPQT